MSTETTTERPIAARVMEEGAGWKDIRFDAGLDRWVGIPPLDRWVGIPPFPEGDLWGSSYYLPEVYIKQEHGAWMAWHERWPTGMGVGTTEEAAIEKLIANMRAA